MKRFGATKLWGLLIALMVLMLAAASASAHMLTDWENLIVSVVWTDDSGVPQQVPAWSVPEDQVQHGYWVTLPAEALGKTIRLEIVQPDPLYFFHFNTFAAEMQWQMEDNALDLSDAYAQYVGYMYDGVPQVTQIPDFIKLYLSTQQPPFEVEELPGAELFVPEIGGAEFAEPGQGGLTEVIQPEEIVPDVEVIVPETEPPVVEVITPPTVPAEAVVRVEYYHESGWLIDAHDEYLAPGEHIITPRSGKTGSYELTGEDSVWVWVDNSGYTQTTSVMFTYRDVYQEPAMATIPVYYYHQDTGERFHEDSLTLPEGTYPVYPDSSVTSGLELVDDREVYVTVYANGTASVSNVTFLYRNADQPLVEVIVPQVSEPPVQQNAAITVRYLDDRGRSIASDQTVVLEGDGAHMVTPDLSVVPAGYEAISGTDYVTVNVRNGKVNQTSVSFYFSKAAVTEAPVRSFEVTVYYYDTENREIAPRGMLSLQPGTHRIEAPAGILANGYELVSDAVFELTVYADGSYDRAPEDVGFWFRPAVAAPKTAKISINYVNSYGELLAGPVECELAAGQSHSIIPDGMLLPAAYDVSGVEAWQVTVSAEGIASPSVVSFVAELRREGNTAQPGERIDRYGIVNAASVRFRTEPYTQSSKSIIRSLQKGSAVYMVTNEYNTKGEMWTQVIVDNRTGYMQTQFIDMLTAEASNVHARSVGATPVPTFTPVPTPTPAPTESFVEYITPVPVTPTPAAGYAVAMWGTGLRTGTGSADYIMDWVEEGELVSVSGQFYDQQTMNTWSFVRKMDGVSGYVQQNALRTLSDQEAAWYLQQWQQQNPAPAPTELVTNTPEPMQQQGYGYTLVNNVPFRQMPGDSSRIMKRLSAGTVVYIAGQQYVSGAVWQYVAVDGQWGYIRGDLVHLMTIEEEDAYLDSLNATPTPTLVPTRMPSVQESLSSYGYVSGNEVNFRAQASTSARSLGMLNKYALCLVLGTETVNGQTWYHISHERTEGYIHGKYFKQMTNAEFEEFLRSDMYQQGIMNNGGQTNPDNSGVSGSNGLVSGEDEVLDNWYQSGGVQITFPPFVPVGTPEPIVTPTPTPTTRPAQGYVGSYLPVGTPVVTGGSSLGESSSELPLPGTTVGVINPPQNGGGNDKGSPLAVIIVVALLAVAGAGVFAFAQHQRKRRQMAMRAAQRRAQQARNAGGAVGAQGRTGAYFPQQPMAGYNAQGIQSEYARSKADYAPAPVNGQSAPAAPAAQRPYARQSASVQQDSQTQQTALPRMGRRTAYQQSLAEQQAREQNHQTDKNS